MDSIEELLTETLRGKVSNTPPTPSTDIFVSLRWRRRRRRFELAAGAAAVAILVGGGIAGGLAVAGGSNQPSNRPAGPPPTPGVYIVPTSSPDNGFNLDAAAAGPLRITFADGKACAWIDSGRSIAAYFWTPGYRVRLHPARLIGPDGAVVATAGQTIIAGGGYSPATHDLRERNRCATEGKEVFSMNGPVKKYSPAR